MSLKLKLISCISAFVLVLGLLFVGVWAVNQGSVQMGGNVSFTATDVYAKASGSISGAGEGNKTLPTVIFDADNETPDVSGWTNLDLAFDAVGSPITMEIVVENLATDRSLTVNLKDNFSSSAGGLIKDVKNGDSKYTGSNIELNASTGSDTSTTTFTITLSLSSKNNSLSDTAFGYTINLYDASYEFPAITGFTFTENNDGTATLTGYTGTDTEVVIPSSYSIKMVDGVKTYIEGNDYLVTSITSYVFRDCSGLTSVTFGENSQLTTIGMYAFRNCDELTSITIPESVTTIGDGAFSNCSGLETMNYLGTLESWCAIEFDDSDSNPTYYTQALYIQGEEIAGEVVVPEGIETLAYTFYNCKNITSVSLPNSLTSIGDEAFRNCDELTSITIPESVTTIGDEAFRGCIGLTSVNFGENSQLTTIGNYAFYYCIGLTSITLPSSLTTIGKWAFYYCIGLTSITIPEGVTTIGAYAFSGCSSLTSITIPERVTTIGEHAFSDCSSLTSIHLPSSLTSIDSYAFFNCTSLTSITIPDSVTTIGNYAFDDCIGLTSVNFGENSQLTTIGSYAFWDCSRLTNITIPNSATTIGSYAFWGCDGLTSVTIPDSVTTIGDYAFLDCDNLTSITFNTPYDWEISSDSSFSSIETTLTASQVQENALEYLLDTYVEYYWRAVV